VKNKVFAERLEEKMMSDLRKMIIVGIITVIIIVAYFVGQLVLISSNELQIKDNSQSIKTML
jgi:predicted RND superfamily exporter protein